MQSDPFAAVPDATLRGERRDVSLPPADPASGRQLGRLVKPACLLLVLLAAGLGLRALGGHAALPAIGALQHGLHGRALFLVIGTLICALGLPRQAVCFAAGLAYGVVEGTILSSIATVAGCVAAFLWARLLARDWARARLAGRGGGWLTRLERLVSRRPFAAILTFRLLPVGSSLALNLAAGVLGVGVLPFALATLLGGLPQTVIFTLLGSGTRIGHDAQIAAALVLFVGSGLAGLMLLRRGAADA